MKWLGPIAGERMLSNGPATEMASVNLIRPTGVNRSQDDAMVGYFFQRPQTDPDFQHYTKQPTRWAIGDDSAIEARHAEAAEMENDFQALALETGHQPLEIAPSAKKLWGVEESGKPDEIKSIFLGNQWRDAPWSTGHMSEHVVSQPIMMQRRSGSYPGGDINSVLSPRSSETGGLGVKMVEYVLGTSPTTAKDMDARMARLTLNVGDGDDKSKKDQTQPPFDGGKTKDQESSNTGQTNGIVQNGLEDDKSFNRTPGSRQPSPSEEDMNKNPGLCDMGRLPKPDDLLPNQAQIMPQSLPFDSHMEPMAIDPIAFDYSSQLIQSMDSPNVIDYNNHVSMYQRQQQQQQQQQPSIAMLTQQQYALAAQQQQQQQQLGMPPAPFTSNSYIINPQDPYAQVGPMMPGGNAPYSGPTVMPPYYGMPPWGMCAPNILQQQQGAPQGSVSQQQQHMMRGNGARPMTPQQSGGGDGLGGPGPGGMPQSVQTAGGQYPVITQAYYDQNSSQMVMSNRNLNGPMRLVSPAPVVVNPNQPGNIGNNSLRMMSNQAQQMQNHSSGMYSGSAPTGQNSMYTPTTSGLNFPQATSSMGFSGNSSSSLNFNHAQQNSSLGYGNNALGTIGTPSMGAIGNEWDLSVPNVVAVGLGNTSSGSQRRDSFDRRDNAGFSTGLDIQRQMPKGPQYYGVLGAVTPSPGPIGVMPPSNQSLTPPPSLSGSSSNLSLGALMSGNRIISAAPGAETKYRNGTITPNMLGSSSLFPMRTLQRNSSLEKPTGRSRLLEDFRNNRFPNLQLRDLVHHIVEFSQDQHGSRFIQQKLERATSTEKQMVFNEILTAAYNLMTDVFGNYVIQKFFEFGTPEQKQTLAQKVRGHVLPLALQMYGCRVIQKALESIPPDQQKDVVKELDGHVLKCVKDQNGNHVVQKCIECVDPMALQFIINAFQGQVYTLSTHPYGCRVIQRILEHCTSEQTSPILEELHQHTEQLVQDQYGNYVIQHVLEHGRTEDKSKIVAVIRGKVLQLSQHKFASNVVEKCITHATRAERAMLIEEVCAYIDGALYTMMKDQFANYVVQKMIDVAESPQRKSLMHKIRPHVATLRKFTYGKHILAKLEKHLMKNNDLGPIGAPSNGGM